jgi:hypothetical protein
MSSSLDDDPWVGAPATARAKPIPRFVWWGLGACGSIALLAFAAFVFFLYKIGEGPETSTVAGDDVPPATIAWLVAKGLLERDEDLVCFYSAGMFDAESEGSFCTDRRVVHYRDEPEWTLNSVAFADLARVGRRSANLLEQEVELHLTSRDGASFAFLVPMDGFGEPPFETWLRGAWRAANPAAAFAAQGLWHPKGSVPPELRSGLVSKGGLAEDEDVLALFGWEGTPLAKWGTLCTPRRLVCYSFVDATAESLWAVELADVEELALKSSVDLLELEEEAEVGAQLVVRMQDGMEHSLHGDAALLELFLSVLGEAHAAARR